jgi:hypothetical protein
MKPQPLPMENLELQAVQQRSDLHKTVTDLREHVESIRERMSVSRQVRQHAVSASIVASILGLLSGYGFAGMFTRR